MAVIKKQAFKCDRCDHEWFPRLHVEELPGICPKCKSAYWNKKRRTEIHNEQENIKKTLDIVRTDEGLLIPIENIESTFLKEELEKALRSIVNKSGKTK